MNKLWLKLSLMFLPGNTGYLKAESWRLILSEHDFTGCRKTHLEAPEASGHDFSRAANATKQMPGFSP